MGIPDTISDDLRCPPINRRRPPNNLRLVARFCVGVQIQVEIQCLRVVSGDLRLNQRRPVTTRTISVIVLWQIVVNRRVYKGPSDALLKVWWPRSENPPFNFKKRRSQISSPIASDVIEGHRRLIPRFVDKPGQHPSKHLRQCDCSAFIRIIVRIV